MVIYIDIVQTYFFSFAVDILEEKTEYGSDLSFVRPCLHVRFGLSGIIKTQS